MLPVAEALDSRVEPERHSLLPQLLQVTRRDLQGYRSQCAALNFRIGTASCDYSVTVSVVLPQQFLDRVQGTKWSAVIKMRGLGVPSSSPFVRAGWAARKTRLRRLGWRRRMRPHRPVGGPPRLAPCFNRLEDWEHPMRDVVDRRS
ncbi:hypothetical protein VTN77DRAFT_3659 [Rasamsonia byssochlamydoides]|uniref:uncharacterized protein n=1 Tax=Rasamsonia byssochlamydoides TaxID=89139 RepID=UPI003742DBC7